MRIFKPKLPPKRDKRPYVGVELEFFMPCTQTELAKQLSRRSWARHVTLKEDESLHTSQWGYLGHELAILLPEEECKTPIMRITRCLRNLGAKVNETCGLHVHLDMRNRNRDACFKRLVEAQGKMYSRVAKHRLNNEQCLPLPLGLITPQEMYDADMDEEGWGIRPGLGLETLEVRMHEGTLSGQRINAWVRFLTRTGGYNAR